MTALRKVTYLLLAMSAIILLPWFGAMVLHGGLLPDTYFKYPPLAPIEKEPFNIYVFSFFAFCCIAIVAVYVFPQLFGFKKLPNIVRKPIKKVKFPLWFWIGLVCWGVTLFMLWTKSQAIIPFLHWSDLPLFWGFVLVIDGWVYVRNGGKSLISEVPQEVVGIGLASIAGWMIFEYLNFFIDDNWYYPKGDIIDREQFLMYALIISSGLLTLAFIWYSFFQTFPNFSQRYSNGPKIILSETIKNILIVLSLIALFLTGIFPDFFFFTLWLSPPLLLVLVLDKMDIWSPFRSIGQGNWSPVLLFALTYLLQGFILECQNYYSGFHLAGKVTFTEEPAYWQYSLPFVDILHVFEMPLLGFFGYLPFGIYCWVWWISCATLIGIPSKFYTEKPIEPNTEN